MHTYELVTIGGSNSRTVRGWQAARHAAVLAAARTQQAVEIWALRHHGRDRTRTLTVFPDGSIARATPLHRLPQL
jgi:hypothetical protein